MKSRTKYVRSLLTLSALGVTLLLAACGGGGSDSSSQANVVDRAFVAEMIPHHTLAVDMAKVAAKQGQHPETRQLAANIISTQNAEIQQMRTIQSRIGSSDSEHGMDGMSGGGHMTADAQAMGLSMDEMGMSMNADDLKGARPFDREFIDMMIPHHAGAMRMARAELTRGDNAQLKSLARGIITAQSSEIKQMHQWRVNWFGSASGGMPGRQGQMNQGGRMPPGN